MLRNVVSLYLFFAVIIASFFTTYVLSRGKSRYMKVFSALGLCVCLYLFGYLLEINSLTLEQMIFWNQVQYLGVPFFPALWLILALMYTKRMQTINKSMIFLLYVIPVITFILRITNSFHYFFYSSWEITHTSEFPLLLLSKGPWYYVQMTYVIIAIFLTTLIFYRGLRKGFHSDYASFRVLLGASVIPTIGILMIYIDYKGLGIDYSALLMPISSFLILYTILKHDFLEVKTLARETIFENSKDAMILLDNELRVLDYNIAAQDFFLTQDIILQIGSLDSFLAERQALLEYLQLEDAGVFRCEDGGNERFYEITSTVIRNDHEKVVGILKSIRDVTDKEKIRERLKQLASTDELSGLSNRRNFIHMAQLEFERTLRYHQMFSVIILDIDDFKLFNDSLGHAAGDAVIREIGRLIRGSFRKTDISGRIGGEEFAILLQGTSIDDARLAAEQFRRNTEDAKVVYCDTVMHLTVSIGVSCYFPEARNIEDIIKYADQAMYESKAQGKNRTTLKRP